MLLLGSCATQAQTQVIAKNSGKCLDVQGISTKAGAAVQQWECWGGPNQQWVFNKGADGYYQITSVNSGFALAVDGDSSGRGAGLTQWEYSDTANENWSLRSIGGGYYNLVAQSTGMCLDVRGGPNATGDGVLVQQWPCSGQDNQAWQLVSDHSVSLTWDASSSSNVTGYYVYRATASGGPYTKLSSLLKATSYVDGTVEAGRTYYYATTATDASGQESSYSNRVEATIP